MKSGRACSSASGWRIGMCVPGKELPLLVRVAVDGEVEQVGADAAVVEKRVALAGGAVAGHPLALPPAVDQELEQAPLGLLDPRRELAVALQRVEAQRTLAFAQRLHLRADGCRSPSGATLRVDAQRPAVGGQLVDVEHLEAVRATAPSAR